ncbi:MAG: YdcH family protein [Alphaproteobacteria bacterium]
MTSEQEELQHRLVTLATEHADMDAAITALSNQLHVDQLQVQRLKRRKLALKDQIAQIRDRLQPDIIA